MSIQNNNFYNNNSCFYDNKDAETTYYGTCLNGHLVVIRGDAEHLAAHSKITQKVFDFVSQNPLFLNSLCNDFGCKLGLQAPDHYECAINKNDVRLTFSGVEPLLYDPDQSPQLALSLSEFVKLVELNGNRLPTLKAIQRLQRPQKEGLFEISSETYKQLLPSIKARSNFFALLYKKGSHASKQKNAHMYENDEPADYTLRTAFELTKSSIKLRNGVKRAFGEPKIVAGNQFFSPKSLMPNNNNNDTHLNPSRGTTTRKLNQKKVNQPIINYNKEFLASLLVNPWFASVSESTKENGNNNNSNIAPSGETVCSKEEKLIEDSRTIYFTTFACMLRLYYEVYNIEPQNKELDRLIKSALSLARGLDNDHLSKNGIGIQQFEQMSLAFNCLYIGVWNLLIKNSALKSSVSDLKVKHLTNLLTILNATENSINDYVNTYVGETNADISPEVKQAINFLRNKIENFIRIANEKVDATQFINNTNDFADINLSTDKSIDFISNKDYIND